MGDHVGCGVINVGSFSAVRPMHAVTAYSMSKAGLEALTKCAALELAPRGIRVNAIHPATVATNIHKRAGMSEAAVEKYIEDNKAVHPLGRAGTPEDCAELIVFLASEGASWMTGECITLDGGRSLLAPVSNQLSGPSN
mmetsp:Transcript_48615/g.114797  ORF Transcript_48615/g.114797 Transcript_48615/m.114797 type:complete len:139 (+) Transcript_48615:85-501(+)